MYSINTSVPCYSIHLDRISIIKSGKLTGIYKIVLHIDIIVITRD